MFWFLYIKKHSFTINFFSTPVQKIASILFSNKQEATWLKLYKEIWNAKIPAFIKF